MDYEIKRVQDHTEEWLRERSNGLGSSDVGAVLGLNEYRDSVQVFYEKIFDLSDYPDNTRMFWGREMESLIAENWQYWDGTEDGYVENKNNGTIQRKCRQKHGILVSKKYPWLRANIDREMVQGSFKLTEGVVEDNCPVEIKTINSMEMRKWEAGIPPNYLAQVTDQMIVMGVDYSEIALFDNYRNFFVYPVEYNEDFANTLIEATKTFWNDRVLPAKEARERLGIETWDGDLPSEITDYAPDVGDNDSYRNFMSERAKIEPIVVAADDADYDHAYYEKLWNEVSKVSESIKKYYRNKLVERLSNEGGEKLDFGSEGYFSWMEQSNAKYRVPRNQTAFKFDKDSIKEELKNLENKLKGL